LFRGRRIASALVLLRHARLHFFGEVLGVKVGDVEESVFADAEVDEGGLDGGLHVRHAAFVDVADVRFRARTLHIEFFKLVAADDGDADFFAFHHVDEHVTASQFAALHRLLNEGVINFDILGKRRGRTERGIIRNRNVQGGGTGHERFGTGGQRLRRELDEVIGRLRLERKRRSFLHDIRARLERLGCFWGRTMRLYRRLAQLLLWCMLLRRIAMLLGALVLTRWLSSPPTTAATLLIAAALARLLVAWIVAMLLALLEALLRAALRAAVMRVLRSQVLRRKRLGIGLRDDGLGGGLSRCGFKGLLRGRRTEGARRAEAGWAKLMPRRSF
jgi:hypothetical protein